ncbi:MAG: glycosyl hydrolase-related protein [Clostridia bacterium]|nr:glycosyl hydrolase-related protein [Clostridia bacterium]
MESMIRQVKSYLNVLGSEIITRKERIDNIEVCPSEYKENNIPPEKEFFTEYEPGSRWGSGNDSHAWFSFEIEVPEEMKGDPTLTLCVETDKKGWDASNPQFLCYVDGIIRQAFDTNHRELLLNEPGSELKNHFSVKLYAYTGPRVPDAALFVSIITKNSDAEKLWYDISVPFRALECTEKNTPEYMEMLTVLSRAISMVDFLEPRGDEFRESVKEADEWLHVNLYEKYRGNDTAVICIGHTHIDIAWKWTVAQTREKAQRSFATVVELMKRYPEYKFMSSQSYLYKAVKEEAPELYAEIKRLIKEGRWEVEGAMWVEADCNLPSGESLVRQILYGKRFFKEEFGVDSRVLWLPDVFGYSAALPQILRKSGVDWFVTSKISWNDMNVMPYDLFKWRGIDGTSVNTFFITAQKKGRGTGFTKGTTYVGNTDPDMIAGAYNRFQQKELSREAMVTFGFGDGGGGPTYEMLEIARRQSNGLPGQPKAKIEFAGDLLKRLEKNIDGNPRLPEWRGELYLEYHRGTYTANARNKRYNRRSEFLLEQAELMASASGILFGDGFPRKTLRELWEMTLVNQFHDIIPGSSIREVYEVTDREYADILKRAGDIIDADMRRIADSVNTDKSYVVFNPHSFAGNGTVMVDGRSYTVRGVPSKGWKAVNLGENTPEVTSAAKTEGGYELSNRFYTVVFDSNCEISSIYDKENGREVLVPGERGNSFRIYEDYPDKYDAWEIQEFSGYKYRTVSDCDSAEIVSDGVRSGLHTVRHHSGSLIEQTVWVYDSERRIDFETHLDWHSKHRILRTAFPVDINTDRASFEIQYGFTERPTHSNTSWDRMKFETCGHKYADMSEGNYGVSLLNDCKYGHNIHGNTMMLTLLKRPTDPSEVADEGEHFFTYSLLPHAGTLMDADTVAEAYMLNLPMTAVKRTGSGGALPEEWSLIDVDRKNVVVEAFKETEYGGAYAVRLYESRNYRTKTRVTLGFEAKSVEIADLLENPEGSVGFTVADGKTSFVLDVKPFEIITLIIR